VKVSRICFGTAAIGSKTWQPWAIGEAEARPLFKKALDLGITYFDTANRYSIGLSEEVTGTLLKEMAPRDQIVLSTKVCGPMGDGPNDEGLSRKHIMESIDASLRRLKTDYVDLYVVHRYDAQTPIEEAMDALNDVVKAGKARYIGASSMAAYQFAKMRFVAERNGWANFVSMQNLYNLLYREEEREMIPYCVEEGVGLTPWSPLARGFFANRRGKAESIRTQTDKKAQELFHRDVDFAIAERVDQVAVRHGVKPIQVALAWMLAKPGIVSPVVGAIKENYVEDAVAALDIALDSEDMQSLEELYEPRPVYGFDLTGRGA
ncbi:MAG: aldo/keto reductase, partial [Rhodospirillales bacterium]|nr:aldo/keto reductase [Rhodospirillales bacterium]